MADWRGRRVLVTGATGFIGTHLCRALAARGAEVHGVSRSPASDGAVRHHRADLAEPRDATQVVEDVRPDVVFHLASRVSGDRSLAAVAPTVRDNLLSTVNVLTAATDACVERVILAGSMEEPSLPGETPSSPYAAAKAAASLYARLFLPLYGLPVVTLRVFMVYGPGRQDGDKLVPYVIRSLLAGGEPDLTSGTREVDWVYVDDVVAAFVAAAEAETDRVAGETFDVGSGTATSVREIAERLTRLAGQGGAPRFGTRPDRPLETERIADLDRTRQALGWAPATAMDDGLLRTVDWFRAHAVRDGA